MKVSKSLIVHLGSRCYQRIWWLCGSFNALSLFQRTPYTTSVNKPKLTMLKSVFTALSISATWRDGRSWKGCLDQNLKKKLMVKVLSVKPLRYLKSELLVDSWLSTVRPPAHWKSQSYLVTCFTCDGETSQAEPHHKDDVKPVSCVTNCRKGISWSMANNDIPRLMMWLEAYVMEEINDNGSRNDSAHLDCSTAPWWTSVLGSKACFPRFNGLSSSSIY